MRCDACTYTHPELRVMFETVFFKTHKPYPDCFTCVYGYASFIYLFVGNELKIPRKLVNLPIIQVGVTDNYTARLYADRGKCSSTRKSCRSGK